jgi:hypothetical protein
MARRWFSLASEAVLAVPPFSAPASPPPWMPMDPVPSGLVVVWAAP